MKFQITDDNGNNLFSGPVDCQSDDWTHMYFSFWVKTSGGEPVAFNNLIMGTSGFRLVKERIYHRWLDKIWPRPTPEELKKEIDNIRICLSGHTRVEK